MRNNNYNAGTATMTVETTLANNRPVLGLVAIGLSLAASILGVLDLMGICPLGPQVTVGILFVTTLMSYALVGFGSCMSRVGRFMKSGFNFPVIPINLIIGGVTFLMGLALGFWVPAVFTILTYFRNR